MLRLRVRLRAFELLAAGMGQADMTDLLASLPHFDVSEHESPQFEFDVPKPTIAEQRGPKLHELRQQGLTWPEIAKIMDVREPSCRRTYMRWRQRNGMNKKDLLWEKWGGKMHQMRREGKLWDAIAEEVGMSRWTCIGAYQRWKKKNNVQEGLLKKCEQYGPTIHDLRGQSLSFTKIGERLGVSRSAVASLYRRWLKATGAKKNYSPVTKTEKLGPVIDEMRANNMPFRQIAEDLKMTTEKVYGLYRYWKKCKAR